MGFFDNALKAAKSALDKEFSSSSTSTDNPRNKNESSTTRFAKNFMNDLFEHTKREWGMVGPTDHPKWNDSNIGGVGSDRDKQLRKAAAESEKAFEGAGEKLGIEIWRVEQFKPVRMPPNTYGGFYTGDSYIILHTYQLPGEAKYRWDLFFWLGAKSTQDEKGAAAYYTVNIDDKLDTFPVQHREVQYEESKEFKELFKGNLKYLEGGVDPGWKEGGVAFTGTPNKTTFSGDSNDMIGAKLNKVLVRISDKGGEIELTTVDEGITVKKSHITDNDPYALVVGDEAVYIYCGTKCSPEERLYVADAGEHLLHQLGFKERQPPITYVKQGNEPPQWKTYVV